MISKDRTYKKKIFSFELDDGLAEPDFDNAGELKGYVTKLLGMYEFLDGLDCIALDFSTTAKGSYKVNFTFWIDEIDILREEHPHLFV